HAGRPAARTRQPHQARAGMAHCRTNAGPMRTAGLTPATDSGRLARSAAGLPIQAVLPAQGWRPADSGRSGVPAYAARYRATACRNVLNPGIRDMGEPRRPSPDERTLRNIGALRHSWT